MTPDYVVMDATGHPVGPDTYSNAFKAHARAAGLPEIRLHDARRTAATLLHTEYGVPAAVAAKWLGHDPNVYMGTYVAPNDGDTAPAEATSMMARGETRLTAR